MITPYGVKFKKGVESTMKIIGVKVKQGDYEGYHYDNLQIFTTEYVKVKDTHKEAGEAYYKNSCFNVKRERAGELFKYCNGDLSKLLGLQIEVYFDQYNKAARVDILDTVSDI